jgi:urease accessory protein
MVFGRSAMGESVVRGSFCDDWRISYNGSLVFADRMMGSGDISAMLARPAVAAGASAIGCIIVAGEQCEQVLETVRSSCEVIAARAAASARNHVVVVRLQALSGQELRTGMMKLLDDILRHLKCSVLGRTWYC